MIAIPNIGKPQNCAECPISALSEFGGFVCKLNRNNDKSNCPLIDIVTCGECKHRPIKDDPDGADYGFNIVEPTDGDDLCPYLVEDGWYSWMPNDNFYCGRGERSEE